MAGALSPAAQKVAGLVERNPDIQSADIDWVCDQIELPRWEVVQAFKALDAAGLGRFVVGRRDWPTRFLPQGRQPQPVAIPHYDSRNSLDSEKASQAHHVYVLNRVTPLEIRIPIDITTHEADRISRWIQTLPQE